MLPRGQTTYPTQHPLHMFQHEAHMQNPSQQTKHLRHDAFVPSGETDNDAIRMKRTLSDRTNYPNSLAANKQSFQNTLEGISFIRALVYSSALLMEELKYKHWLGHSPVLRSWIMILSICIFSKCFAASHWWMCKQTTEYSVNESCFTPRMNSLTPSLAVRTHTWTPASLPSHDNGELCSDFCRIATSASVLLDRFSFLESARSVFVLDLFGLFYSLGHLRLLFSICSWGTKMPLKTRH